MIEYPKIETLWNRDEKTGKVLPGQYRCPEFEVIDRWFVTEKIDGTNIRIGLSDGKVDIRGRTDNAQIPPHLLKYLQETFSAESLAEVFSDSPFTLFGEGYGPKIQRGGGDYSPTASFRLFDVKVGHWWLEPDAMNDIAMRLNIHEAPHCGIIETDDFALPALAKDLALVAFASQVARLDGGVGCRVEGIVARSSPLMLTRRGDRVMWKLKYRDFQEAVDGAACCTAGTSVS